MSLTNDLVPYVSDPGAAVIHADVVTASWVPDPAEAGWQLGTIQFRVRELLSDEGPKAGEALGIAGRRYGDDMKRLAMGFDQWNVLPFEPGREFVLAIRPVAPGSWTAVAAELVTGNSTQVADLRVAFEMERVDDPALLARRYEDALQSRHGLLSRYALDAITRRARVPRAPAAEAIVRTMAARDLSPNDRLQLVQAATKRPIYEDDLGADRVNQMVIGALARVLADESDPDWLIIWAQTLATSILPEFSSDEAKDRDTRTALIRSVPEPARGGAAAALGRAAAIAPDARISRLAEVWTKAVR
jgi:hypothetical protein